MLIRRFIVLTLAAVLVFTCFGCGGSNGKSSELYKYYVGEDDAGVTTLMKFNAATGVTTPVCEDPLCHHNDKDCPFYRISNLRLRNTTEILYI